MKEKKFLIHEKLSVAVRNKEFLNFLKSAPFRSLFTLNMMLGFFVLCFIVNFIKMCDCLLV